MIAESRRSTPIDRHVFTSVFLRFHFYYFFALNGEAIAAQKKPIVHCNCTIPASSSAAPLQLCKWPLQRSQGCRNNNHFVNIFFLLYFIHSIEFNWIWLDFVRFDSDVWLLAIVRYCAVNSVSMYWSRYTCRWWLFSHNIVMMIDSSIISIIKFIFFLLQLIKIEMD